MAITLTRQREQAHELIDRMAPGQIAAVVGLMEILIDPVARSLANAPYEDEPISVEEIKALNESREWLKHNKAIAHEQVLAELGITQEEIDNYSGPQ